MVLAFILAYVLLQCTAAGSQIHFIVDSNPTGTVCLGRASQGSET
jgi:hypothetical protein